MAGEGSEPVSVLMVAIGGYGFHYLKTLLEKLEPSNSRLAGVVDPMADRSPLWPVVKSMGVPACSTVEEFYDAGHSADLAVISSPIHWHVPQSLVALSHGSCVLCDKPIGATIQEARELGEARDRSGRWVMIGYQWSFSAAIQALKRDILAGSFGRPLRLSTLCCWPRDTLYYTRNDWAGHLRDRSTGRWILDSPANNAMAHYLHNLFFVLGPEQHLSAKPQSVQAELYRAYPVDTFDTAACRTTTDTGAELLFFASHVTEGTIDPRFRFEFEEAIVTFGEDGTQIVARQRNGRCRAYGAPDDTPQFHKLFTAIRRVSNEGAITCGPEAAAAQTLCVNGMHDSMKDASEFPAHMLQGVGEPTRRFVRGLEDILLRCYREGKLPSEAGVSWAAAGRNVNLAGYKYFPGGTP